VDTVFTVYCFYLGVRLSWCYVFVGLSSGALFGGYGVPSIYGTICILFRPYLASCGNDV